VLVELSPLYPTIAVALLAGLYSRSPLDGLVHSAVLAVGDAVVGMLASWLLGYEYAEDMRVGDPGFLRFVSIQFFVLLFFVAVLVEAAFLVRWVVQRFRRGRPTTA
jgi:chromate transport protein ChrA